MGLSIAAAAVGMAINKAMDWAEIGAKALQVRESFAIVAKGAGEDQDKLLSKLKEVSVGAIGSSDLMQKAVKGMVMGLSGDQIIKLTEAARVAARVSGEDVSTAYESITDAISTNMPKALKRYGLISKEEMALVNKAMAAGVEDIDLYGLVVSRAAVQAAKMGPMAINAAERIQEFHNQVSRAKKEVGLFVLEGLMVLWGIFQAVAASVMLLCGQLVSLYNWFGDLKIRILDFFGIKERAEELRKEAEGAKQLAQDLSGAGAELMAQSAKNLSDAKKAGEPDPEAIKKAEAAHKSFIEKLNVGKKSAQEYANALKEINEAIAKNKEELAGAGLSTYAQDMAKVQSEMVKYRDKGLPKEKLKEFEKSGEDIAEAKAMQSAKENRLKTEAEIAAIGKTAYEKEMLQMQATVDQMVESKDFQVKKEWWAIDEKRKIQAQGAQSFKEMMEAETEFAANENDRQILQLIKAEKKKLKEIEALRKGGAITEDEAEGGVALVKKGTQQAQWTIDLGKNKEQADFLKGMSSQEDVYIEKRKQQIELERQLNQAKYGDIIDWAQWAKDEQVKMEGEILQTKLKNTAEGMGTMASAFEQMSQLYAADSKERKTLHEVSMAFAVAEKAALAAQAVSAAVVAIATQGSGDPYTAFVRIAAMVAAMVSLLATAGISFSGSGGGGSKPPAPGIGGTGFRQDVLGAKEGEASQSVSKMTKLLDDTYKLEYRELRGIHYEVKNLNQSIKGLVASIIRSTSFAGMDTGAFDYKATMGEGQKYLFEKPAQFFAGWITDEISRVAENFGSVGKIFNKIFVGIEDWGTKFIGGIVGGMLGGGTSFKGVQEVGVAFDKISVASLEAGQSLKSWTYQVGLFKKEGGWFGKSKYWTKEVTGELDTNTASLFTKVFQNMSGTLVALAGGLGEDVNKTLAYEFSGGKLDLKGLDAEGVNKKLTEYFSAVGDKAVTALFGNIVQPYQQVGEGLMETAARLVIDKAVIISVLEMTRMQFTGTAIQAIALSESLIEMGGGLDKVQEAAEKYYDAFFTEAQKTARSQQMMNEAFADMGLQVPKNRQQYRELVEAQDLTTESGQRTYLALLQMAEAADTLYDVIDDLINKIKSARESMRMEGWEYEKKAYEKSQVTLTDALTRARGGDISWGKDIDKTLSTASNISPGLYADKAAYQRDYWQTYNTLAEIEKVLGGQPTYEEQMIDWQEKQVNVLQNIYGALTGTEQQAVVAEQKQQRELLIAGGPAIAGHQAGGSHPGGWRVVGEGGPELEYTGASTIYSNTKSKSMLDNSEVVDSVKALSNEVKELRSVMESGNYSIAKNTNKFAKVIERWDADGIPEERDVSI
jgi:hypothetical protein